jgi:leader peptidase (prepilin peptidase)/N-methyltransferase
MVERLADPLFWAENMLPGVFFLLLGGLFGSFLNVVAYRVPRGGSVMGRRSHCPRCGAMIRSRDNVPVLGWVLLGGRCYACRGWISARYPIVEAIMAVGVMTLATRELATNGGNLPGGSPGFPTGPDLVFVHASWQVMLAFAWHVALLATLVVWSLFAVDGYRPSARGLAVVVLLLGLVGVAVPGVVPVDLAGRADWPRGLSLQNAVITAALIAGVGAVLGGIVAGTPSFVVAPADAGWFWPAGGVLLGVVLGWQGATLAGAVGLGLAVVWMGLCLVGGSWRRGLAGRIRYASLALPIAAVVAIGWWRPLLNLANSWGAHSILSFAASTL